MSVCLGCDCKAPLAALLLMLLLSRGTLARCVHRTFRLHLPLVSCNAVAGSADCTAQQCAAVVDEDR